MASRARYSASIALSRPRLTSDPVADTQRATGMVLGYMTKMGVSSSVVEAMSETGDVRWLDPKQALAMNLVTDPVGALSAKRALIELFTTLDIPGETPQAGGIL